jgi:salicylate hydroxylase
MIELLFQDGTRANCDLLIGADGVRSSVRKAMLQDKAQQAKSKGNLNEAKQLLASVDPQWSGIVSYRTVIPAEKLRAYAPDHRVLSSTHQVNSHCQNLFYSLTSATTVSWQRRRTYKCGVYHS